MHPKFQPYHGRFIRSSVTNSRQYSIAGDLEVTYHEAIARTACQQLAGRVAQKGREITVWDVWANVSKRAETEVEKAKKAFRSSWGGRVEKGKRKDRCGKKKVSRQLHKKLKAYLKARPVLANS